MIVRSATPADLDAVMAIEEAAFATPLWSRYAFSSLFEQAHARFQVACEPRSGTLTGYIVTWVIVEDAEIANLAVAPEWRRQGVGGQLLDTVMTEAKAVGVRRIHLEVRESNVAAQRLYEGRDFAVVGRRKRYYQNPVEDALLLTYGD